MNPNAIAGLPAVPMTVKTSKTQYVLLVFLGLFFLPIGLWGASRAVTGGFKLVPTVISLMCFGIFATVAFLVLRSMRRLPKVLDAGGITRQDGQRFDWSALKYVEHQLHLGQTSGNQKLIWRIDIHFENGAVWLIPLKIVNFREIYDFVRTLPCEHTEKNYGRTSI